MTTKYRSISVAIELPITVWVDMLILSGRSLPGSSHFPKPRDFHFYPENVSFLVESY